MSEQIRKIKKQTKITLAKQFHFFQKEKKNATLSGHRYVYFYEVLSKSNKKVSEKQETTHFLTQNNFYETIEFGRKLQHTSYLSGTRYIYYDGMI